MGKKKNKNVCLRINGINHHLSKYKNYLGGGKNHQICPECSLYKTHYKYCWTIGTPICTVGTPICSVLADANDWDDNFAVYFKTINRK